MNTEPLVAATIAATIEWQPVHIWIFAASTAVGVLSLMFAGFKLQLAVAHGTEFRGGPYIKFGLGLVALATFTRYAVPLLPLPVLGVVAMLTAAYAIVSLVQR